MMTIIPANGAYRARPCRHVLPDVRIPSKITPVLRCHKEIVGANHRRVFLCGSLMVGVLAPILKILKIPG